MLLAQVNNLIITTKPRNQSNTLQRIRKPEYQNGNLPKVYVFNPRLGHHDTNYSAAGINGREPPENDHGDESDEDDEIIHHSKRR